MKKPASATGQGASSLLYRKTGPASHFYKEDPVNRSGNLAIGRNFFVWAFGWMEIDQYCVEMYMRFGLEGRDYLRCFRR